MAPGWVTLAEISGAAEGCPADAASFLMEGIATNTCWVNHEYNASDTSSFGSLRYSCGDVFLTVEVFSSTSCSGAALMGREQYFLGCSVVDYSYYYDNADPDDDNYAVSTSLQCNAGTASLPLPTEPPGQLFSVLSGITRRTSCLIFFALLK